MFWLVQLSMLKRAWLFVPTKPMFSFSLGDFDWAGATSLKTPRVTAATPAAEPALRKSRRVTLRDMVAPGCWFVVTRFIGLVAGGLVAGWLVAEPKRRPSGRVGPAS